MCTRNPVIVVHGGSGKYKEEFKEVCLLRVKEAALQGYCRVQQGGSALDMVEEASTILENDPHFNAGCGAVLNECGEVELDAIIMDGKSLDTGAVAGVRNIANPTKLARLVMEKTNHVMLSDRGASRFAKALGFPEVPMESLITERSRERWRQNLQAASTPLDSQIDHGTIGAVALDTDGNVACATSTGGLSNTLVGRIGDTPCIGSGGYADNLSGAVSTTGKGEAIMKMTLARLIVFYMERGMSPAEAAETSLQCLWTRLQSHAGVIVIDNAGEWTAKFTTENMPWAAVTGGKVYYGIALGEIRTSAIEDICQ
ncbi:isoaspartyl peptidase/L-asparaginase [Carcharodon carcharias]|uniref:isoaspartyl peptidase/L-asparaginase n=1 Tax=Carcharodon carcharias TaxID=13397 RepID=UPI001B7E9A3F|nr:isoaspartyl peptidase/L-asparaginase [Carcharodon carcharias]